MSWDRIGALDSAFIWLLDLEQEDDEEDRDAARHAEEKARHAAAELAVEEARKSNVDSGARYELALHSAANVSLPGTADNVLATMARLGSPDGWLLRP